MAGYRLGEIARAVEGELAGPPDLWIQGVAGLEDAGPGQITYAADPRAVERALASPAAAVIVPRDARAPGKPAIRVEQPKLAFARVLALFRPPSAAPVGIHPTAVIEAGAKVAPSAALGAGVYVGPDAVIDEGAVLYPGVYVGREARIGPHTVLWPGVVVGDRVRIGARVVVHPGAVIGADGFGYVEVAGGREKIPQIGTVVVEDDVEIGANTTIDRATCGATRIGRGTKIDNLVHVGHNVVVGEGCTLIAQVGIGGSARVERGAVLGGQVGVADHARVGAGATVGGKGAVMGSVPPGGVYAGIPARPLREELRARALSRELPQLRETVRALRKRLEELEHRLVSYEEAREDGLF